MRPSRPVLVVAALALALAGAATAGVITRAGVTKSTITLTEREFQITPSTRRPARGRVRIVVKNAGKYPHALAIRGAGVNKRTPLVRPGQSAVLLVDLRSGSYAVWCPVPGHATRGMKATLSLRGATTSTVTSSDTTTGTTTTETDPIPGY
jgi:hypothetical protein